MPSFFVPCEPVGKGRPRVVRGHAFTPERTRKCEDEIRIAFKRSAAFQRWDSPLISRPDPVEVKIIAFMPIPRSWAKSKKSAAFEDQFPHTSRPDADNLAKTVLDALNGLAWDDDSQIVSLTVDKRFENYEANPGFHIYYGKKELS